MSNCSSKEGGYALQQHMCGRAHETKVLVVDDSALMRGSCRK